MAHSIPTGTELVGESDAFVANDGGRWFIFRNIDYTDGEHYGMSTETLGNQWGYDTEQQAEAAMAQL